MVTLTQHPQSGKGDSTFLLDVNLVTGNVPLDGFAVELLFHTDDVQIADVYLSDMFAENGLLLQKQIDNEHGQLFMTGRSSVPYSTGLFGKVVATLCVKASSTTQAVFAVGERTQLYIHG
jgi:hypothetical protein